MPVSCLGEGSLRAYLDHELPAAEQLDVERHLTECVACATLLAEIRANANEVTLALGHASVPAPATGPAWQRFSRQRLPRPGMAAVSSRSYATVAHKFPRPGLAARASYALQILSWRIDTMRRGSRVGWQPALAAALAIALVAAIITVDPMRAAAGQFLDIFRVRRLAVVQVQTGQLERLEQYRDQVFGKPQIERAQPTDASSAGDAGRQAGFPVLTPGFLPESLQTPSKITVEGGGHARMQVNLAAARMVLQMANLPADAIPADRDSVEVNAKLKSGVAMQYESGGHTLRIVQGQSPDVDVPAGIDLNRIGEVGLQLFGMSPDEAHRFARNIDWSTTLVLPIPVTMGSVQEITLRGTTGYLITENRNGSDRHTPQGGPQTVVVWQQNGLLYAVGGDYPRTTLVQVAESLK